MKTKLFLFILLFFGFLNNNAFATINPNIILKGTTNLGTTGKIVFPDSTSGVIVNASGLDTDTNSDILISGNFWIWNTSSSGATESTYGWATFNIGVVAGAPKVFLDNNGNNTFTFKGYAWSKTAGWIYFGNNIGVAGGEVIYNRTTGKVDGCGWSQNLGWICLDNFILDTTPPDLSSFSNIFSTNHNKTITIPDDTSVDSIEVENWNSTSTTYNGSSTFTHDFRKAKDYYIEITDNSGNSSAGTLQVVAGEPSTILTNGGIGGGATASTFISNGTGTLIANGLDKIEVDFHISDTYGNPIKNVTGIKTVSVEIGFNNNVDLNQVDSDTLGNLNTGDAISFSNNQFGLIPGIISTGTGYSSDGDYSIDISSLAPTKEGYSYTSNNNDIKISNITITVNPLNGNTGVGEGGSPFNIFSLADIGNNYKFTPSVYVNEICADSKCVNIATTDDWNIITNVETSFTGTIQIDTPNNVSNIKIAHLLDTTNNNFVSFQDLDLVSGGTFLGKGFVIPNATNTSISYTGELDYFDFIDSSSVITKYNGPYILPTTTFTLTDSFNATPKIVLIGGLSDYDVNYSSIIEYKNNGTVVKYPSFNYLDSNSIVDNQIKIAGIAVDNNINIFTSEDSINRVGKLSKPELIANIEKNVSVYRKSGKGIGGISYIGNVGYIKNDNFLISSWDNLDNNGIDTLIVDGGDLIISGTGIVKSGNKVNSIVVLKGENSSKGNIWITQNVQKIEAVLFTDKSVKSGDGSSVYTDNIAKNQLYIIGSVISYNTIGGASAAVPKCPYYLTSCNFELAKNYDLNNFRYFIKDIQGVAVPELSTSTTPGYNKAAIVIEYDPLLQTNIPKIFLLDK